MNNNMDNPKNPKNDEVERYRRERVEQFRMNIKDDSAEAVKPQNQESSDFSDEITSFSDETTKAQIEKASKKELRRQKREEKKVARIKAGRNKRAFRIAWLFMLVMVCVVVTQFLVTGCNDFLAIKRKDETEVTVRVKADYTVESLADQLEDLGIIDSKVFFKMFADHTGKADDITPGVYHIPKNKDYLGILNYLQFTGNVQNTIEVTITEGTNILELVEILYTEGVTAEEDKEEFLRLCNSDEFDEDFEFLSEIEENVDREYKLEGYLFPDTYEFYIDEAPDQTIRRFLNNFQNRVYNYEYDIEGYKEPVTLIEVIENTGIYSLDEFVTIASIVQGEAANEEDMKKVSSVIHNRLEVGPEYDIHTLGMDSTIFYPYKTQEDVPEDIRDTFESKYDTYDNKGLPPGAICSPSANALLSAVVPADTDYLYFCHSAEGESFYAETLYEHQSNLSKAGLD
ncbi:MAG: endolytic transglycosylase MltG [Ruminococcus sp.]|nr:endolytic transglycosylase MltG [Ruminococcus sp.]